MFRVVNTPGHGTHVHSLQSWDKCMWISRFYEIPNTICDCWHLYCPNIK